MGVKLVIPGVTFTDPTLPIVKDDPLLTAGSLLLVDPMHSLGSFGGAGAIPAQGATVPNIAWRQAKALLGAGSESSLACPVTSQAMSGSKGKLERTPKGGLHVIFSQTQNGASAGDGGAQNGNGFAIGWPQAVIDYVNAHKTHAMFVSIWHRTTRGGRMIPIYGTIAGWRQQGADRHYGGISAAGVTNSAAVAGSVVQGAVNLGVRTGPNAAGAAQIGTWQRNFGISQAILFADGNLIGQPYAFVDGNIGPLNQVVHASDPTQATYGGHPSMVFYRAYVEDLTISGRTYAEVDALDLAAYTKQVLTAGGRYYGDTIPTDPATIT